MFVAQHFLNKWKPQETKINNNKVGPLFYQQMLLHQ